MYYISNQTYTNSVKAYETVYNILKTMILDTPFQLIYTGSNSLLLRGWPLNRKIKDHDFVIRVYDETHKNIISDAFAKWCEKFPTHLYYVNSYPGDKILHGNIKLTCELQADLFITSEYRAFDEFPNTSNPNNPFYLSIIEDVFKAKLGFNRYKALEDALVLINLMNRVLEENNQSKDAELPI